MLKANTGLVRLLAILSNIGIFQYVTQYSAFTDKIRSTSSFSNLYQCMVSDVHVCKSHFNCTGYDVCQGCGFESHCQLVPYKWNQAWHSHTVKSTVRRMNTPVLISFSTWVHTIFSCLWTVLLFLTWQYTLFWLYNMHKHPYIEKHSLSLQTRSVIRLPQYMIECR